MRVVLGAKPLPALVLLSLILFALFGCADGGEDDEESFRLALVLSATNETASPLEVPCTSRGQLASEILEIRIRAADIDPPMQRCFVIPDDQQTEATVERLVPRGSNREITVELFNAEGIAIFRSAARTLDLLQAMIVVTIELEAIVTGSRGNS